MTAHPTPIAIAVVQNGDCFLVGKRSAGSALAGMSEFPGGKLEAGESPAQAAVRECREETGIEIEILFEYPSQIQAYDHDRVELHFFACRPLCDVARLAEPYRWVPRDQLATLEFPQGNRTLIELLTCPRSPHRVPKRSRTMLADTSTYTPEPDIKGKYYGPLPVQVSVTFGAATHVGLVRTNNEDHYAVVQRYRSRRVLLTNVPDDQLVPTQEEAYALSIADGMGGAACGEIASRLALSMAWHWGGRESRWLMNIADLDETAIEEQLQALGELLNAALVDRARVDPSTAGMGTTLTIVYSVGRHVFVAHIGDSRAYRIRGELIQRLSSDHTLEEELRAAGAPESIARRKRHVLTNCLSSSGDPVNVEWRRLVLEPGDWLLLCTDGLSDLVKDEEIAREVVQSAEPQAACDRLVQVALERGGKDNVTVVAGKYL